jgi:hypothetical protein
MNTSIFRAFDIREQKITEFMLGTSLVNMVPTQSEVPMLMNTDQFGQPMQMNQQVDFAYGMGPPKASPPFQVQIPAVAATAAAPSHPTSISFHYDGDTNATMNMRASRRQSRNSSILSFGNGRHMSMTSEATFGRAMSGLSALSIDWENLDDFDVELDHSSHINNHDRNGGERKEGGSGNLRSSLRRSIVASPQGQGADDPQVTFKVSKENFASL